jgi:hypothetical protein
MMSKHWVTSQVQARVLGTWSEAESSLKFIQVDSVSLARRLVQFINWKHAETGQYTRLGLPGLTVAGQCRPPLALHAQCKKTRMWIGLVHLLPYSIIYSVGNVEFVLGCWTWAIGPRGLRCLVDAVLSCKLYMCLAWCRLSAPFGQWATMAFTCLD